MNGALKAFLRAVSTICLWGGPLLGIFVAAGTLVTGVEPARLAMAGVVAAYFMVIALVIGGVLRLLLSIDDRLERLEESH